MSLTLRAVSLNDQPITQPFAAEFGVDGGSIGRSDANTLALPDPERRISRRQAEIAVAVATGGYVIKNVGSANPIIVGERSLGQGESAPLRPNARVRIGGYLLEVHEGADESTVAPPLRRDAIAGATPATDPFADLLPPSASASSPSRGAVPRSSQAAAAPPLSADNPFADLLGSASSVPVRASPFAEVPAPAGPSARLPDDFDPFAPPPAVASAAATARAADAANPFADLIPSAGPSSLDAMFDLGPGGPDAARDPLAAFLADAPPAAHGEAGASSFASDPLALFGRAGDVRPPPPPPTSPDRTPELRAAFVPPKPMPQPARMAAAPAPIAPSVGDDVIDITAPPPKPPSTPLPPLPPLPRIDASTVGVAPRINAPPVDAAPRTIPPGWTPDSLAAWQALCEGAGVRLDPPAGSNAAFLRVVGMMLRAAVEGTVQMVGVRAATKAELQAQVTVIKPRNNNPLKFAPDAQSALEQLLQPAVRGFLPGPAAMTDAMNDLVGHSIGTMAGTRAALEGVLKRFSPDALEAKLADKSMLDSLVPMNRKAKLWELYLQHWEAIRDEAQEDFHALFGRAFLAAYEQQLERLRREKQRAAQAPPP